ncbi:hypothetical protein OY671_009825, partial [Metschnikowia pulcherrima]
FRRIGAIHEDHYYPIVSRNSSVSGASIEGMVDVPSGTKFVLDSGDGQSVIATVRRSRKHQQGVEFEQEMVADGNGGSCTRHRVSPYASTAAGSTQTPGHAGPMSITRSDDGRVMSPAFSSASEWNGAASRTEAA